MVSAVPIVFLATLERRGLFENSNLARFD